MTHKAWQTARKQLPLLKLAPTLIAQHILGPTLKRHLTLALIRTTLFFTTVTTGDLKAGHCACRRVGQCDTHCGDNSLVPDNNDLSTLMRRLSPYIVDLSRAAVAQTLKETATPRVRSGQVTAISNYTATVRLDVDFAQGNTQTIPVQCIDHVPSIGSRCMVLTVPPAGALLLGSSPIQIGRYTATASLVDAATSVGHIAYLEDVQAYYGTRGTTWSELFRLGAWTTWTPAFNQNGVKATTNVDSKYARLGRAVLIRADATCTAAGTAGNAVVISGLPVTSAVSTQRMGECMIGLAGAEYHPSALTNGGNTAELVFSMTSYTSYLGITPNGALGNGDRFWWSAVYEGSTGP